MFSVCGYFNNTTVVISLILGAIRQINNSSNNLLFVVGVIGWKTFLGDAKLIFPDREKGFVLNYARIVYCGQIN